MPAESTEDDPRTIALGIGALCDYHGPIERLGGLTNRVFRLGDHVLRLPGEGTEGYIDRANEAIAANETARCGVSPAVVAVDPDRGLLVTDFVPDAVTMTPQRFATMPGAPARAAAVLRQLHTSGIELPATFEVFAMIDHYRAVLAETDVCLPADFAEVQGACDSIRQTLAGHPVQPVVCHCDPVSENFLDTGERMWLLDWEYSGMSDPMWDLADLSVEARMDDDAQFALLTAYFGREPSAAQAGRVALYQPMCDLLWTLWGLLQVANGNPTDDYRSYARRRLDRCRTQIERPGFDAHLRAVSQSSP